MNKKFFRMILCISLAVLIFNVNTKETKASTNSDITVDGGTTGSTSTTFGVHNNSAKDTITWDSTNKNVATVSNGVVKAVGEGTCDITAIISENGKTTTVIKTITVGKNIQYGPWSEWTTNVYSSSSSLEVQTTTLYRYYYFYCPVCGGHEPLQGMSDCGRYTLSLSDAHVGWFPVAYINSDYKSYSYTSNKKFTESLGDGWRWNFSTGNLYDKAIGTKDSDSDACVISTGYRKRTINTKYIIKSIKNNPNKVIYNENNTKNITKITISSSTFDYTGKRITPNVKVFCNNIVISKNQYEVTYSNNINVGVGKIVVKGKGKYKGTLTKTFIIIPPSTSISKLSPGIKRVKVNWTKKSSQVDGYQIQYSIYANYKKQKIINVNGKNVTAKYLNSLSTDRKYYVRIRTYKKIKGKTYYSKWSKSKYFWTEKQLITVDGEKFWNNETVSVPDITGDGKADKVKFDLSNSYTLNGYYDNVPIMDIFVNGTKVGRVTRHRTVEGTIFRTHIIRLQNGKVYFCAESYEGSDDHYECDIYEFKNIKIIKRNNLIGLVKIGEHNLQARPISVDGNKMRVELWNQTLVMGVESPRIYMNYEYKNGKLNCYDTIFNIDRKGKEYECNCNFKLYTNVKFSKISYSVKKGDKLYMQRVCIRDGRIYIQFKNSKGKNGWLKSDVTLNKTSTSEPVFVGAYGCD